MNLRRPLRQTLRATFVFACLLGWLGLWAAPASADSYELHHVLQAVDDEGLQGDDLYTFVAPKTIKGIVLNNPDDMLNSAAGAPGFMGGMWQVFIQAVESDDWGGTALWMGEKYGNLQNRPGQSYTPEGWEAEILRLNYPLYGTEYVTEPLRAGDVIEVLARGSLFHKGKRNINEEHYKSSTYDFTITILQRDQPLPDPVEITLADVKDAADDFLFAATTDEYGQPLDYEEITGCEKYQGQLVTIKNVTLTNPGDWGADAMLTLADGTGRTFPMHLGLNPALAAMTPPTGAFDITGIFNQEAENDGIDGYELWVMSPSQVPEPGALVLVASGLLALLAVRIRAHRREP